MLNMLVTIDKNKLAGTDGKVIKAEQFAHMMRARDVVAEAERYAREIKTTIDAEVESARRTGHEDGQRAARAENAVAMAETVARMETAFIGLEARIVNTVMGAVEQILGALDEGEVMERIIRRVLADERAQKSLRLRVSADQFDLVNQRLASILHEFPNISFVDVVKDPNGVAGTCVLECEFGVIDASVDTQLAAVRRGLINAFVGKRQSGAASSE